MERTSIKSSDLVSVGYDADKEELEVEFRGGKVYRYYEIPQDLYDGFMDASSKGKYFHRKVKKANYRYTKAD